MSINDTFHRLLVQKSSRYISSKMISEPEKMSDEKSTTKRSLNVEDVERDQSPASKTGLADFETAIDAAGFGVYNIRLLLFALLGIMGTVFETSTISYVLPSAECDLHLTLLDKGILNAITYAGMITSAIAWGFIADTKGRKTILIIGLLLGGLCDLGSSTSQSVIQLMILKYLGGFIMSGPFAILMAYISEMHGKRYRARIMMVTGFMFAVSSVLLPSLALLILPSGLSFRIGYFNYHTWQIFVALSSIPTILGGILLILMPESPKFLMSQGRNAEALEVFKYIYSKNKKQPKETYPIKDLICEIAEKQEESKINTISESFEQKTNGVPPKIKHEVSFQNGLLQLRPLFVKPYLRLSAQVYLIHFFILMGQNTVRLWLPQLFASINEYEIGSGSISNMCDIVQFATNKTTTVLNAVKNNTICEVIITPKTYMNNLIVGFTNLMGYIVVSIAVNLVGTKRILLLGLLISGSCGIFLFWSASATSTLITAALYTTFGSISSTSIISSSVNLFPTSLRTMIVSLAMMFGRSGSIVGNVIFPIFMSLGCIHPFLLVSIVMFLAFVLAIFLPSAHKTSLK